MGVSAAVFAAEALTAVEVIGAIEVGSAALGAVEVVGALEAGSAILGASELAGSAAISGGLDAAAAYEAGTGASMLSGAGLEYSSLLAPGGTAISPYVPDALNSVLGSKVTQSILGQAAGTVASSVLGGKDVPGAKAPPAIAAPVAMPLPNDKAVANARRRSIAAQQARQGRASTILSDDSQRLGN